MLASFDSYPIPRRTMPPRAVSRTATSTSRRARIWCAPPGPVQSPGSIIRSSIMTPSDVVVPTRRPARIRMCVIRRVTVLLPFVPEIDTTGIRRSTSRSHSGGVARAPAMRSVQRARSRSCAPVRRAVRDGETSRSARASAASVSVWARSAPTHGKVMIQCPGSDERWTATPPRPSPYSVRRRRIHATVAATGYGHSRAGTAAPRWTRA